MVNRIEKELKEAIDNPPPYIRADTKGDNLYEWAVTLTGILSTPCADGVFVLDIASCPLPPVIYHCKMNSKSKFCDDKLDEDWTPVLAIGVEIGKVVEILREPDYHGPLVRSIVNEFIANKKEND